MNLTPEVYAVAALTILYPALLIVAVLLIRWVGRKKAAGNGERRHHPIMRQTLNIMAAVPVVFIASYIGMQAWSFVQINGITPSPTFYFVSAFVILYVLALSGVILVLRLRGAAHATKRTGSEERRVHQTLRQVLNFLMVAPFIFGIAYLLARAMAGFD